MLASWDSIDFPSIAALLLPDYSDIQQAWLMLVQIW